MDDRASVAALRDALAVVVELHPAPIGAENRTRIKDQVRAVVDDLRAAGWPPERVIVALKHTAYEAGLRPTRFVVLSQHASIDEHDGLIVDIVRWCIEQYYELEQPSDRHTLRAALAGEHVARQRILNHLIS
jgi:Mg-chelatase subunit ChlD